MRTIAHACESTPGTTASAQKPAHTPRNVRLPTRQGCETHVDRPDKPRGDAGHSDRTLFCPIATKPLNELKFQHNRQRISEFAGVIEPGAAFLPVVSGQPLPVLIRRLVADQSDFAAWMETPSLRPISHARLNGRRSPDDSTHWHGETAPGSDPSLLPAQAQLEIPNYPSALRHLYSSAT